LPGVLAELFRPPLGFAAIEVVLQLCDVRGEVAFARRKGGFELGAGLIALYIITANASNFGKVISSGADGGSKFAKTLQGR